MVRGLSGTDSSVKTFSLHKKQWSFYKTGKMCLPFLSHKQVCWGKRGLEVSIKSELGVEMTVRNIRSCSFLQKKKNTTKNQKKPNHKVSAFARINLQLGSRAGQKKAFTESTNHLQVICYPSTLPYELKSDTNQLPQRQTWVQPLQQQAARRSLRLCQMGTVWLRTSKRDWEPGRAGGGNL